MSIKIKGTGQNLKEKGNKNERECSSPLGEHCTTQGCRSCCSFTPSEKHWPGHKTCFIELCWKKIVKIKLNKNGTKLHIKAKGHSRREESWHKTEIMFI